MSHFVSLLFYGNGKRDWGKFHATLLLRGLCPITVTAFVADMNCDSYRIEEETVSWGDRQSIRSA
jgi:hypothetical protein